jgi:hypothetical protein
VDLLRAGRVRLTLEVFRVLPRADHVRLLRGQYGPIVW